MADTPRDSKAAGMEGEGKWEESVRDGVDDTDPLLPEVLDGALGGLCMDALKRPNYTAAYLRVRALCDRGCMCRLTRCCWRAPTRRTWG